MCPPFTQEDTLNIPVAYYTCGLKAFLNVRIYEANFAITEVHVDLSIVDSK